MTSAEYLESITSSLKLYDWKEVEKTGRELINYLYSTSDNFNVDDAAKIMQQLRNKRLFNLMQDVGDVLIQTGRHNFKTRRLYAQALIDQNNITAAISILNDLENDTHNYDVANAEAENAEANGLLGRCYKQLYINAGNPQPAHSVVFLTKAILSYLNVYTRKPQTYIYQGINTVALLKRAQADGIKINDFPSANDLALSILKTIDSAYEEGKAGAWDFATAAEACLALGDIPEALRWLSGYTRMPYIDAFELASTLRQMQEVWQLNIKASPGTLLLPLLQSELLKKQGGNLALDINEIKEHQIVESAIKAQYELLKTQQKSNDRTVTLEKVFGEDSFQTYKWFLTGMDRGKAVARIGRDSSKGFGTGFLLKGTDIHESLGDQLILLTNTHVVSTDPAENALRPDEAIIIFEALNRDEEFTIEKIDWSSPSTALDATVILFSKADHERLAKLTAGVSLYPVSEYLPVIDASTSQKIYVIGHPYGGTLQVSLQDNLLLDHQDPKIHYRTPTDGGSSGSPVFNRIWQLIGLHHAGSNEMNCLNNKPGVYQANEGIWIQSIRKQYGEDFKRKNGPPK